MQRWGEIKTRAQVPKFVDGQGDGEIILDGYETSPAKKAELKHLLQAIPTIVSRIMSMVEMRDRALNTKMEKKKALVKDADIEMAQVAAAGPSMQSLIDKAVNAKISALEKKIGVSRTLPRIQLEPTLTLFTEHKQRQGQTLRKGRHQVSAQIHSKASFQAAQEKVDWEQAQEGPECEGWKEESSEGQRKRKGKEVDRSSSTSQQSLGSRYNSSPSDLLSAMQLYKYRNPHSLPDSILEVPYPVAINMLISHTPSNIILASSYRSLIHESDGVTVPPNIQLEMSVGMKFLFQQKPNSELITTAWKDFEFRLRHSIQRAMRPDFLEPYDPDFVPVPKLHTGAGPKLPAYIEFGIRYGRDFMRKQFHNIPNEILEMETSKALQPSTRLVQKFLIDNDYVVTPTDKNLGLAVSKRTLIGPCILMTLLIHNAP